MHRKKSVREKQKSDQVGQQVAEFDFKPVGDEGIPLEQIQFELRVSGLFKWPSISYQLV